MLGSRTCLEARYVAHPIVMTSGHDNLFCQEIRLALNCVGGKTTRDMLKLLGSDAHLVSYGAMSKEPLSIPTSYFIFKNLAAHGFWQSRWYNQHSRQEREGLMKKLTDLQVRNTMNSAFPM